MFNINYALSLHSTDGKWEVVPIVLKVIVNVRSVFCKEVSKYWSRINCKASVNPLILMQLNHYPIYVIFRHRAPFIMWSYWHCKINNLLFPWNLLTTRSSSGSCLGSSSCSCLIETVLAGEVIFTCRLDSTHWSEMKE